MRATAWAAVAALVALGVGAAGVRHNAPALPSGGGGAGDASREALAIAALNSGGQLASEAAAAAAQAAKQAWAFEEEIKKQASDNLKYVPMVKAQIATAKAAAETAAEEDEHATKLLEETRVAVNTAALKAARDYILQVRQAAAEASAQAGEKDAAAAAAAEVRIAQAAARAAMPYHANLLRLQRVEADYQQRAQALAVASNHLKAEGMTLASSAEQYQRVGQVAQANQIMVTAHSLVNQGERMKQQAQQLYATMQEFHDALPVYQQAEQAAADSAAAAASPPELPQATSALPD